MAHAHSSRSSHKSSKSHRAHGHRPHRGRSKNQESLLDFDMDSEAAMGFSWKTLLTTAVAAGVVGLAYAVIRRGNLFGISFGSDESASSYQAGSTASQYGKGAKSGPNYSGAI